MRNRGERLVGAASRVMHERGSGAVTLAGVAEEAAVPLGNVYYYFKTKDDLVAAVVAARIDELRAILARAGEKPSPVERLCALVASFESGADDIVRAGCPYGTLASELAKDGTSGPTRAGELLTMQLAWIEKQFRALGARGAKARAFGLLSAIQGACVLAHAMRDASVYKRQLSALARQLRAEGEE